MRKLTDTNRSRAWSQQWEESELKRKLMRTILSWAERSTETRKEILCSCQVAGKRRQTESREIYPGEIPYIYHSSDDGDEAPPVPIPNTEVKLICAEGTLRATARKIRSLLLFIRTCWTAGPFFVPDACLLPQTKKSAGESRQPQREKGSHCAVSRTWKTALSVCARFPSDESFKRESVGDWDSTDLCGESVGNVKRGTPNTASAIAFWKSPLFSAIAADPFVQREKVRQSRLPKIGVGLTSLRFFWSRYVRRDDETVLWWLLWRVIMRISSRLINGSFRLPPFHDPCNLKKWGTSPSIAAVRRFAGKKRGSRRNRRWDEGKLAP